MPMQEVQTERNSTLERATEIVALGGGVVLLASAALVCASVLLRWLTSQSVPGDFEFVQIGVAVSAFAFMPYCQIRRGNIFVETFTVRLPNRARQMLDALWELVYAGFAALIAWRLAVGAWETIVTNTTSMVLALPIGWAIVATAIMAALLAVVSVATAFAIFRGHR